MDDPIETRRDDAGDPLDTVYDLVVCPDCRQRWETGTCPTCADCQAKLTLGDRNYWPPGNILPLCDACKNKIKITKKGTEMITANDVLMILKEQFTECLKRKQIDCRQCMSTENIKLKQLQAMIVKIENEMENPQNQEEPENGNRD